MTGEPPKVKHRSTTEKMADTDAASRLILESEAKTHADKTARLRTARLAQEAQLDEALDESFPASDPVEIGHAEHLGAPKRRIKRKASK